MFVLSEISDICTVAPQYFAKEEECIRQDIKDRYVNKVVKDVGLVVALYDILEISISFVSTKLIHNR
jgi:DNA-directed RNA polymerase III subunit RPC8